MEERNVVLVIKTRHNAQNRVYEASPEEVPAELAQAQLSVVDEKRNFHFRGVRYATEEEKAAYYGTKKTKPEEPKESIQADEVNNVEAKAETKKVKEPKVKA